MDSDWIALHAYIVFETIGGMSMFFIPFFFYEHAIVHLV
jgi:hypothetical protein